MGGYLPPSDIWMNPNNEYQASWDAELMTKIETDDIRNAFIRMLLDRWDKHVLHFTIIPVPNEIKDTSSDFVDDYWAR